MTDETPGPRAAVIGDNNPPEPTPPMTLQERLAQDHAALAKRIAEIDKLASEAPSEVLDEATFAPLSDLLKAGRVALAASEAARKIENEESRRITAQIDAWFKNPAEALKLKLAEVKTRTDVYLDEKKAAEERRRRAEADRKAAEAAEKALDALWADARAELAAYDARKAIEFAAAERLRKEAAAKRADHLKDRAKRLGKVEPYLATRAERREKAAADEAARIAARQKAANEAAARAAELQKTKDAAKAATAETAQARRSETKASNEAATLFEVADDHAESAETLGEDAGRLGKRAERADRHANAGSAAMSRTRSEMGTTSSLTKSWRVKSFDRDYLDLNSLRGFLHPDAVATAVRGYMMAHKNDPGGPQLDHCEFEQVEEGAYR